MDGKTGSEDLQKEASALQTMDPPSNVEVEKNGSSDTAGRQDGNSDQVSKRNISEVGEGGEEGDEEGKRKKRKDSGCNALGKSFGGRNGANSGKCPKTHLESKTGNKGSCSSSSTDRKSPSSASGSAGPSARKLGTENEGEEIRSTKSSISSSSDSNPSSSTWAGGLKVPPLKIVIPQQSSSSEQDQGNRNGKAGAARHHQALPYVVTSTSSSEPITDKEIGNGGAVSSTDKGDLTGLGADSHHQRVLRSSHRSGNGTAANGSGNGIQTPVSSSGSTVSTQPSSSSVAAESSPSTAAVSDTGSNNSSPPPNNSQHPSPSSTETVVPVSEPSTATPTVSTEEKTNESPEQESQQQQPQQQQLQQQQQPPQQQPPPPPPPPPPQQPPQQPSQQSQQSQQQTPTNTVQLHPRKRKIKQNKESLVTSTTPTPAPATEVPETSGSTSEPQPPESTIPNSYQSFRNIRKQVDRRRKGLFPVQPKPPQGFKDYLMNRCTYLLAGNAANCISVSMASPPPNLQLPIKNLFIEQEKERRKLQMQHIVEKEKLVLAVEQEILRVHGRAARALANQSLPFSVCTILKDEEIYNEITPEQEEKDRNARSRYNGRLFLSWLQDVDDKWEKIKTISSGTDSRGLEAGQ
ncbi:ankyrin repeat domain-containing protein 11 isoform X2 [Anabrus simplex]|uniref:ankyrin repeat domain-containing protein 11 isoform X2 n=1 Tax=Anabrus simplex TaxID=316456 RepID=UPI0035A274F7